MTWNGKRGGATETTRRVSRARGESIGTKVDGRHGFPRTATVAACRKLPATHLRKRGRRKCLPSHPMRAGGHGTARADARRRISQANLGARKDTFRASFLAGRSETVITMSSRRETCFVVSDTALKAVMMHSQCTAVGNTWNASDKARLRKSGFVISEVCVELYRAFRLGNVQSQLTVRRRSYPKICVYEVLLCLLKGGAFSPGELFFF